MNSIIVNSNANGWLESKYKIYKNLCCKKHLTVNFHWLNTVDINNKINLKGNTVDIENKFNPKLKF